MHLGVHAKASSNRTFMELKFINITKFYVHVGVLIVPLWNWNSILLVGIIAILRSNRTFMELKLVRSFFSRFALWF